MRSADSTFQVPAMRRIHRIHFIGVGGSGMSGIAEVLATWDTWYPGRTSAPHPSPNV